MLSVDTRQAPRPSLMSSVFGGLQWGLDRTVAVGYGVVYDFIFEGFAPYRALREEVLELVASSVPPAVDRRQVRVLDVGCGPGNFSCLLAEHGFSVVGIDPYGGLIELAREKRRAARLPNLAFLQADIGERHGFGEAAFDQLVNIHSLYTHPAPERVIGEAYRVLKPGGHAVFANHTRRVALCSAFTAVRQRDGLRAALHSLRWLVPNLVFEAARKRVGPHYWSEDLFARNLAAVGFTVLDMRRTFFDGTSLLVWARKDGPA